jgi:hypothetical protein
MGGGSDGEFKKEKLKLNTKKKRIKPKGNRGRGGNKKDGDA